MNNKYFEYLQSKEWKEKKNHYKDKFHPICGYCNKFIVNESSNLHHITYDNIYNEKDEDLVLLHNDCHAYVHEINFKDQFYKYLKSEDFPIRKKRKTRIRPNDIIRKEIRLNELKKEKRKLAIGTGTKHKRIICKFCEKDFGAAIYKRFHGDKCKYHPINLKKELDKFFPDIEDISKI